MQSKHVSSAAQSLRLYQAIRQATICFPMKNLGRGPEGGQHPSNNGGKNTMGNMPFNYTKKKLKQVLYLK